MILLSMHAFATGPQQDDQSARILRIESALQPPAQLLGREVSYRLADRMAYHKVPGLSVAVFENGKVVWAKGWGVLEAGSSRQVDTHTIFQAASIGKPLTATLVMKAVARGQIGLDQPVNELLREWKVPENEFTRQQPVTLRLLLTHRAGILVGSFLGYKEGEPLPSLVQILNGEPPATTPPIVVDILPGTEERYSDFNYAIIQQLLIESLGAPFRELMQREVLDPAGTVDSGFEQPLAPERRVNATTGHKLSGEPISGKYRIHPDLAPSGLWATPTDICRWCIALLDAWQGTSERMLSQTTARQMLSEGLIPVQKLDGGDIRFQHAGNNVGFTSVFCAYTRGSGVAVMSNSNNFDIINEVLRAIAVEYGWEDIKPMTVHVVPLDDLSIYAGAYKIGEETITVSVDGDHLVAVTSEEGTLTFYPESATDFVVYEQALPLKFEFDESGNVVRARNARGLPIERIRPE
jgi:CubicO group peptidase (beta-lactamase class C family)